MALLPQDAMAVSSSQEYGFRMFHAPIFRCVTKNQQPKFPPLVLATLRNVLPLLFVATQCQEGEAGEAVLLVAVNRDVSKRSVSVPLSHSCVCVVHHNNSNLCACSVCLHRTFFFSWHLDDVGPSNREIPFRQRPPQGRPWRTRLAEGDFEK